MRRLPSAATAALTMSLAATAACLLPSPASAHHGWSWTSGRNVELTGTITSARLGNPHGVLEVMVDGESWTVEVGQPWRNERAGLKQGDLVEGATVRFVGEVASDPSVKRLKVERLSIGDTEYVLYPGRD